MKQDGNYNTKNLSKAEMDAEKRLRKKRARENVEERAPIATAATDLNKKRKITETVTQEIVKEQKTTEAKPWEERAQEDQEVDERWDVCENC